MFRLKFWFLTIIGVAWQILAIPLLPIVLLLFAKKVYGKQGSYDTDNDVQRYQLPKLFRFAETPDEYLPGGLYEPTVRSIYDKVGWYLTSYYWLTYRNCGHGITWGMGKEVPNYLANLSEEQQKQLGIYRKVTKVLGLYWISGWKVVRDWQSVSTNKGFWAVPIFTVRAKQPE